MTWYCVRDRNINDEMPDNYTLSMNKDLTGWETDSGAQGYGLPQEVCEWICEILNKSPDTCPFSNEKTGYWRSRDDN